MGATDIIKRDRRGLVAAHLDAEQRKALAALARHEDRSIASILRRAVAAELARAEKETAA
jgi:predicted transcriptional regulator